MGNKEIVLDIINSMKEDEINFLYNLFSLGRMAGKKDIIKLINDPELQNFDTAYPVDYFRDIENIYPDIKEGVFVYDYSKNKFGSLLNINNLFTKKIIEFFQKL